jgi:hypothetical protein
VPKVTIDFGDGRKLERTLTGNSIHYILDSEGGMIEALPGLYGPKAFLRGLEEGEKVVASVTPLSSEKRASFLRTYHEAAQREILAHWHSDLKELGLPGFSDVASAACYVPPKSSEPVVFPKPLLVAASRAGLTKAEVEMPMVAGALANDSALAAATDEAVWARIAALHKADAELDAASIAFMQAQNPMAGQAMPLAVSKRAVENPMMRLVRTFQNTIAIDSVRNEYTFHRQIHAWLAGGEVPLDIAVNDLNERVYAQLFLTPSSDPWLGLIPGDVYTALDNNGVCKE